MYLPSDKLEARKSCSKLSKASLMSELKGSIAEGPPGVGSCWPCFSSRLRTEVEDLGIVSLGSGSLRMVSTSSEYCEGKSAMATSL